MKRMLRILFSAAALSVCMSVPAFAAQTRAEYRTEAAPVKDEIKKLQQEIKALREENKAISEKFKAIRTKRKETGELTVSKENWQAAKALRTQLNALAKAQEPEITEPGEAAENQKVSYAKQAAALAKEKRFDEALSILRESASEKQERKQLLEQKNAIWKQIDAYLN